MKYKHFYLIALIAFLTFSMQGFAQVLEPAKWSYKTKKISDTEIELQFHVKIDKGWHLYSQYTDPKGALPLVFKFEKTKDYQLVGKVIEPKATEDFDDVFKVKVLYFSNTVVFRQKIKVLSSEKFKVKGEYSYQLCDDERCIPFDDSFTFDIEGVELTQDTVSGIVQDTALYKTDTIAKATNVANDTTAIVTAKEDVKKEGSLWVVFFVAFGLGLLALITPCVFPMIPMTVSFFMKGGTDKKQGLRQALIFGISIVLIFTVLGLALTLLFGDNAMYIISTHWAPNIFFFAVFMFFAFSFFGLFDITISSKVVNKTDAKADKGGFLAPFFIALTTVLVSFSCTGPILGTALIELSSAGGDRLVPLVSMFGFSIGFALPFTLLALSPSLMSKLKSGSWLNTVKVVFGFIEVALALKFLSTADLSAGWRILDRETYLALWIVVFTLLGFYLLGKLRFKGDSELKEISVPRLFLSIITFSFVIYMIPGLWGAPLKAISGYVPPMNTQDFDLERIVYQNASKTASVSTGATNGLPHDRKYSDILHLPTGFEGFFDLEEAKAYAKQVNKPIFIDFTGKTCPNCREMEISVWSDSRVKKMLNEDFVIVALYHDVNIDIPETEWITTNDGKVHKTLGRRNKAFQTMNYNSNTLPYYVLIDANGKALTKENKAYDKSVDDFVKFLEEGLATFKNSK